MAATTLTGIRAGLVANLKAAIPDCQATGYLLSEPTHPGFEMWPVSVTYDSAMSRGIDEWVLMVRGYVGTGTDIGSQKKLDVWVEPSGSQSVKAAIEADRSLGGACMDLQVTDLENYGTLQHAAAPNVLYLCAEWSVRILGTGH